MNRKAATRPEAGEGGLIGDFRLVNKNAVIVVARETLESVLHDGGASDKEAE